MDELKTMDREAKQPDSTGTSFLSRDPHDADHEARESPKKFGQYEIVREVGRGGMASVFEGRHPQLGSRVALKVMQAALAAQPMAAARFLREAKAAAQIRHQNVVEMFDIGTQDGVPFIVMEFLEGSDLAAVLSDRGPLPLLEVVDIFLPVLSAVETAHRAGIVHRDLKPANVMITKRAPHGAHPMVLDFGISKVMGDDLEGTLTRSASLLGTVQYMAPELTKGAKFASPASDQYALGVMLYECATGRRPFTGESYYDLMHAIVTASVTPPSQVQASLSHQFDAVVLRAMSRNPKDRFPSVEALGSALLSFAGKATWVLWGRELVARAGIDDEPWNSGAYTLDDLAAPTTNGGRRWPNVGPRWARWTLLALTAYAASATILLARREVPDKLSPAIVPLTDPTIAVPSNAMIAPTRAPISPNNDTPAIAVLPSDVVSVPSSTRRRTKPTQTDAIPSKPIALRVTPPVASNAPSPTVFGTNCAPIVE